jgi:hypothetical protein
VCFHEGTPSNLQSVITELHFFFKYSVNGRVHCICRSKGKRMYKGCLLRTDFLYISYRVVICKHFSLTHYL